MDYLCYVCTAADRNEPVMHFGQFYSPYPQRWLIFLSSIWNYFLCVYWRWKGSEGERNINYIPIFWKIHKMYFYAFSSKSDFHNFQSIKAKLHHIQQWRRCTFMFICNNYHQGKGTSVILHKGLRFIPHCQGPFCYTHT